MRLLNLAASAALVTFGATACSENVTSPRALSPGESLHAAAPKGSGLTLNVVPNVDLPLDLGGSVTINQAVITNFAVVENLVGAIIGVQATGTLSGTAVNALGQTVGLDATPFVTDVAVTSSGPGQCGLVTIDLTSLKIDGLGLVDATVPANVSVKGSGAVGSLLCNLGSLLSGLTSGLTSGAGLQGVVNGINNQIGG